MSSLFKATVVANDDPLRRGRVRVWVWGIHHPDGKTKDKDKLPWAEVIGSTEWGLHQGVGITSILAVDTTVWVMFEQDDFQCPVVLGVLHKHVPQGDGTNDASNSDNDQTTQSDEHYGRVMTINTASGLRIEMNDYHPRIHITTCKGFELDLNEHENYARILTPCCGEIDFDCNSQKVSISNGQGLLEMMGTELKFNGTITANMFWPNFGAANSSTGHCDQSQQNKDCTNGGGVGGSGSNGSNGSGRRDTSDKCNPMQTGDGSYNSCNSSYPRNDDMMELGTAMTNIVNRAQEIYRNKNGENFKVLETKMSAERWTCLKRAGNNPPEAMVTGRGVELGV